jgi:prophage DNA circulation protein
VSDDDFMAPVVELRPNHLPDDEQRPLHTKTPEKLYCHHHRTSLDSRSRRVTCLDCGDEVEAFKVLATLARDWEHFIARRKNSKNEADRAQDRVAALLKQETNAKSRRRRRIKVERAALPDVVEAAREIKGAADAYLYGAVRQSQEQADADREKLRTAWHRLSRALGKLDGEIRESA